MHVHHFPIADCPILPSPANGAVTQSGVLPGATATYTCDAAYQLVGSDERTCDSNAMWTDSEPVCARKYYMTKLYLLIIQCDIQVQCTLYIAHTCSYV